MPAEDGGAIAIRLFEEAWNRGNLGVLDELLDGDFVSHDPVMPNGRIDGIEGYKSIIDAIRSAFPDLQITVDRHLTLSDQVVCLVTFRGTNRGSFGPIAPTGMRVTANWINILRIVDGKVTEEWITAGDDGATARSSKTSS